MAVHVGRARDLLNPKIYGDVIGAEIADTGAEINFIACVSGDSDAAEGERPANFTDIKCDVGIGYGSIISTDDIDRIGVPGPPVGQAGAADVVAQFILGAGNGGEGLLDAPGSER